MHCKISNVSTWHDWQATVWFHTGSAPLNRILGQRRHLACSVIGYVVDTASAVAKVEPNLNRTFRISPDWPPYDRIWVKSD